MRATGASSGTLPPGSLPSVVGSLLGTRLDDRYELGTEIGRGGMGVVYRAIDLRLERSVAVKILREEGEAERRRFSEEMRTLARFTHQNLVRLLDAGELDGRPYLVMDLIEGTNLAERFAGGPVGEKGAAQVAAGIAAALAYVHEHGVVHRDVKPANVLLDPTGTAHLADFGIARLVGSSGLTATGLMLGTPAYLSPEQVRGGPVGPAADVYALGLIILECLTGGRAFDGTTQETMAARLHRSPEIPTALGDRWRQLIGWMTALDAEERPTASAVATAAGGWFERAGHAGAGAGAATVATSPATVAVAEAATELWPAPAPDPGAEPLVLPGAAPVVGPVGEQVPPVERTGLAERKGIAWLAGAVAAIVGVALALVTFTGSPSPGKPGSSSSAGGGTTTPTSVQTASQQITSRHRAAEAVLVAIDSGVNRRLITSAEGRELAGAIQPLIFKSDPLRDRVAQFDQFVSDLDAGVARSQISATEAMSLQRKARVLAKALSISMPRATTVSTTTAAPATTTTAPVAPATTAPVAPATTAPVAPATTASPGPPAGGPPGGPPGHAAGHGHAKGPGGPG